MAGFYKKRTMEKLEESWGKEDKLQNPDFRLLEDNFARMMKKDDWIMDDQTWNDLEMNRAFMFMNRTYTSAGQQCLYNMLRILLFDETELKRRDRMVSFFQLNKEKREKLRCLLHYVGKDEADSAASLLFHPSRELPPARAWVMPCTLGMIASLLSIPVLGMRGFLLVVVFFIINLFVHNSINKYTEMAVPGIRYIVRMLTAAEEICKLEYPELEEHYSSFFAKVVDKCSIIRKKSGALGKATGFEDPVGLGAYVQILFLTEARAYLRCIRYIDENAPALRTLYRRLGELDALQSMGSFKRSLRHSCRPTFTGENRVFRAVRMGHPLIQGCVCNDISIEGKNVVITGSNMSGKSTFLRTIGINMVLAQTFYVAMAKSFETCPCNLVTSISPSDNMDEGKSYYMAEATALLRMLDILSDERCSFLLIDEIFRGTNPLERVAGASSLLEYLGERNATVIVATHDAEITENIRDQYDAYHFEELVTKDTLEFDYLLKEGPLTRPNGIRILEYLGYPREIVDAALERVGDSFREGTEQES